MKNLNFRFHSTVELTNGKIIKINSIDNKRNQFDYVDSFGNLHLLSQSLINKVITY